MSTGFAGGGGAGTSYTPSPTSSCYDPRMTRAQALARIAAGTLNENCVVVITDGPTIGCGPTSATEIELQPQSPTDLGMTGLVHTTFDTTAWHGRYDIASNLIIELRDNHDNVVRDETGVTLMTQFPWGFSGDNVFGNNIDGNPNLVGWCVPANAGAFIGMNNIRVSFGIPGTINLTGVTNGNSDFINNEFYQGFSVTLSTPGTGAIRFLENTVANGSTFNASAGANGGGGLQMTINHNALAGFSRVDLVAGGMTGNSTFRFDENRVWDAFRANITPGAAVTNCVINGNEFRGAQTNAPAANLVVNKASGSIQIDENNFDNDSDAAGWTFSGTGADDVRLSSWRIPTATTPFVSTGAGNITVAQADISSLTTTVTGTGGLQITRTSLMNVGINYGAGANGRVLFFDSDARRATINLGAGATRSLQLQQVALMGNATINQNRTGGALIDTVGQANLEGAVVTLAGAVDPTVAQFFLKLMGSGTFTFTDPQAIAVVANDVLVTAASIFNAQAGHGLQQAMRVGAAGTFNTAAFAHTACVLELQNAFTATASNVNRQRTAGFSNLV